MIGELVLIRKSQRDDFNLSNKELELTRFLPRVPC